MSGCLGPAGSRRDIGLTTTKTLGQARMIQICQRAGLSLAEIKELGARDRGNRIALIKTKRAQIAQQVLGLRLADKFLAHIADCEHPVISECPECSAMTGGNRRRRGEI